MQTSHDKDVKEIRALREFDAKAKKGCITFKSLIHVSTMDTILPYTNSLNHHCLS